MKKLFATLSSIATTSLLMAGPAPADATTSSQYEAGFYTGAQQDYSFRVGFVGTDVSDRKLKFEHSKAHLNRASFSEDSLSLTLGLFNHYDVYVRLGSGDMMLTKVAPTTPDGGTVTIRADEGAVWALGARGDVYSADNTTVSLFAEYNTFKADVTNITSYGGYYDSGYTGYEVKATNWALGANAAYTYQVSPDLSIVPSLGLRLSTGKVHLTNGAVDPNDHVIEKMKARGNLGATLGLGFYVSKVFGVNVEASFFDESAVSVSAEVRI